MITPQMTPFEVLTDPDEGSFLVALAQAGPSRAALAQYSDFLRDRDDVRSEFVLLSAMLSGPDRPADAPFRQARYAVLLARLAPYGWWLRFVRPVDRVLNCGNGPAEPLAVRFRFECPKRWEELEPTDAPGVRRCGDCRQDVHYCDTVEAAERHALSGHCITVTLRVTNEVGEPMAGQFTGQPDVPGWWAQKLFGDR